MLAQSLYDFGIKPAFEIINRHAPTISTSSNVAKLMIMIAAHESGGFKHVRQMIGPAVSFYQIEPATLYWAMGIIGNRMPAMYDEFAKLVGRNSLTDAITVNSSMASIACRLVLYCKPFAIPTGAFDAVAMSAIAKKHWNSDAGKATSGDYLRAFNKYGHPVNYD